MHEPVLKNRLNDLRSSLRLRHQNHVLRLHISRKLRVRRRCHVVRFEPVGARYFQGRRIDLLDHNAGASQL
jgi:hypothetical protein